MAASYESPTEYIQHHLTFLTKPVGTGGFWTRQCRHDRHVDRPRRADVRLPVAGHAQGDARRSVEDAGVRRAVGRLRQRPGQEHLPRRRRSIVAPIALTTFVLVLFMNAMDFLPIDIVAVGSARASASTRRLARRADRRRQHDVRARTVGVRADDLLQHQDQGPRRLDPRAVLRAVRLPIRCCGRSICCSTSSNTCRSRCRIRCGCSATCTPARSSSCCSACGRRPASSASIFGARAASRLVDLPHPDRRAAGVHLHDADRRLHRDGARAPLIRLKNSRNALPPYSNPPEERKVKWTSCNWSR